jgi:hypothetical protein
MRPEHRVAEKPDAIPTLVEAGISKNLAHRARNAAAASAEKFEQIIKAGRERIASESDRVTTKPKFLLLRPWNPRLVRAWRDFWGGFVAM